MRVTIHSSLYVCCKNGLVKNIYTSRKTHLNAVKKSLHLRRLNNRGNVTVRVYLDDSSWTVINATQTQKTALYSKECHLVLLFPKI